MTLPNTPPPPSSNTNPKAQIPFKVLITILIVIAILGGLAFLLIQRSSNGLSSSKQATLQNNRSSSQSVGFNQPNSSKVTLPQYITDKEAYDYAKKLAIKIYPQTNLVTMSGGNREKDTFNNDINVNQGKFSLWQLWFTTADKTKYMSFYFSDGSFGADRPTIGPARIDLVGAQYIDPSKWNIDAKTAIQKTLQNGAEKYLPYTKNIYLTLSPASYYYKPDSGLDMSRVFWQVTLKLEGLPPVKDMTEADQRLKVNPVRVDAETGKVQCIACNDTYQQIIQNKQNK